MPIYTGKSADGSDMHEAEPMHVSSCGRYYSNQPFTPEQEKALNKHFKKKDWKSRIKALTNR